MRLRAAPVAVLGAGSWGTALAVLLAGDGEVEVRLWTRGEPHAEELRAARENRRYLPGVQLPAGLRPTSNLEEALAPAPGRGSGAAGLIVGALPSTATRDVACRAAPFMAPDATWLSATKGIERGTLARMSELVRSAAPDLSRVAVLSGPSFAKEVSEGQPTAVVVASDDLELARELQAALSRASFRAYASRDVVGVELGGAVKNVVAIAAGMLVGLGLGHDPAAALITRGLHEISRLALAMGAEARTLSGLAGLGDLVLTCTGALSRNRRLGEAIALGRSLEDARRELGQVAEGVETTAQVLELARRHGVEMPITEAVARVLAGALSPAEAVHGLMTRELKDETET